MKQAYRCLLICVGLLFLAGCLSGEQPNVGEPNVDVTDLDALTETYLDYFVTNSSMWTDRSWHGLEDINPDYIVQVCADKNFLDLPRDWEGVYEEYNQPADAVEAAIRTYFDVSVAYLRGSQYYDPETHTYQLLARGSGWYATAISASLEDNLLVIEVGIESLGGYAPGGLQADIGHITPYGTLTVDLSDPQKPVYIAYLLYEKNSNP